jgi:hypothetical protein
MTAPCPKCTTSIALDRDVPTWPDGIKFDCPHCMSTILAWRSDDGTLRGYVFIPDGSAPRAVG